LMDDNSTFYACAMSMIDLVHDNRNERSAGSFGNGF
jgi:hypothetical protein